METVSQVPEPQAHDADILSTGGIVIHQGAEPALVPLEGTGDLECASDHAYLLLDEVD